MNKFKKMISVILVFSMIMNYLLPIVANAEEIDHGNTEDDYCFIFNMNENDFPVASVKINNYDWEPSDIHKFYSENNIYTIEIKAGKKGNLFPRISTPGGFDEYGEYTAIPNVEENPEVEGDEYIFTLVVEDVPNNNPNACSSFGVSIESGEEPIINEFKTANLNVTITGEDLEWHEPSDEASHFTFGINDSPMIFLKSNNLNFDREDEIIHGGSTIYPEQLEYAYDESGTVTFNMHTTPSEYVYSITINGEPYDTPKTREQLIEAYDRDGLCITFSIPDVPYSETYDIVIEGRRLTGDDQLTGGFGWNYSDEGDVDNASDRIPNGEIHFVKAVYNNVEYNSKEELLMAGNLFFWQDAIKKDHYEIGDRDGFGYAFFPVGTVVTVEIIPYQGYQLVGLKEDHRNVTRDSEHPGVYTFEIHGGGDALGVVFELVDNEVRSTSNSVVGGDINTNQEVQMGTIKLEVNDANVTEESRTAFETTAEEAGYEIENYLDLSLYNTVYKGIKDENNEYYLSWDSPIENLDENATITLGLEENMDGKDIVIIHEKHEDENHVGYDTIEVQYNEELNTITFETNSFSNYAIATKNNNVGNEPGDEPGDNPGGNHIHMVYFDPRSEGEMEPQEVIEGEYAIRPKNPSNGNKIFAGWYEDEDCTIPFDFEHTAITRGWTLFAKWEDPTENYQLSDGDNTIEFEAGENRRLKLNVTDYLKLSKEEVMDREGISSEFYDEIFGAIKDAAKGHGTLISMLDIEVIDLDVPNEDDPDHYVHEGPFRIRIPLTEEMKKYDSYKLLYIDDTFGVEQIIDLYLDEDEEHLVGTLDHLSVYLLVGTSEPIPDTGFWARIVSNNSSVPYLPMVGIGLLGLMVFCLIIKKKRVN